MWPLYSVKAEGTIRAQVLFAFQKLSRQNHTVKKQALNEDKDI